MKDDPNDRFVISDLSNKLGADIDNENTEKTSLENSTSIEDALSSEIITETHDRKEPDDELFNALVLALGSQYKAEKADEERKRHFIEEQEWQIQEKDERQRLAEEQARKKAQEEAYRQKLLMEEEKQRIEKEKKLAEKKKLSRFSEKNMYVFNLDQPCASAYSGHRVNFTPLPKARKAVPPAEALDSALSELNQKTPPAVPPVPAAPKEAPDIPKEAFDAPKEKPAAPIPEEKPVREPARVDEPSDTSAPRKKEKEEKEGGHLGVVITLLIALAVGIALFILVRMYLPNITGLISGTPAQNTSSVTTSSQPAAPDEQESQVDSHESAAASEDTSSVSEITEESEPETVENESIVPEIPEDPNDIAYIASVNEKASADEIAELDAAAPRLYLSSYGLKISAGTSFNALSYVENAEDDVDSKDRLYTDISVDGLSEMKTSEPGTYELVFYCYDSSGNRSNRAKMTVIVE